jgi:hypothetical protein
LIGLLQYFDAASSVPEATLAPAAVERSVQLDRFSLSSYTGNQDLATVISQLPLNRCYIVPVVSETASTSTQCQVLGFALLNLASVSTSGGNWIFQFNIGESLPVPNAACSPGLISIPRFDGTAMPAASDPQGPFAPRKFDLQNNILSARPLGVVLAPTVSPRKIVTQ